jgi:predicted transposase YbfD/YdcC
LGVENGLHWVLDVTMNEDQSRNRKDHGPENIAMLRRLALNLGNAQKQTIQPQDESKAFFFEKKKQKTFVS